MIKRIKWIFRPALVRLTSVFLAISILCHSACKETKPEPTQPLFVKYSPTRVITSRDSTGVLAVIEIPAGTALLQEMDTSGVLSITDEAQVDFLPYPGNYGFIAGTGRLDTLTGEIRPLPVLVMMYAVDAGSIVEVHPVAVLSLKHGDVPFPVIIATPADSTLRSIRATGFVDFLTDYDAARHILEQWFLNYRGRNVFGLVGWRDEHYARQMIADWKQNS